jgi:hypothetical protein
LQQRIKLHLYTSHSTALSIKRSLV